jgi:hypothetical protein
MHVHIASQDAKGLEEAKRCAAAVRVPNAVLTFLLHRLLPIIAFSAARAAAHVFMVAVT